MARKEARLFTSIWSDRDDFCVLPAHAQRVYFLALSQPDLSYCGVLSYTAHRWAALASDTTAKSIRSAVTTLTERGYFLTDETTEEVLIRSFIRHDGILRSPNLIVAMGYDWERVHSEGLRKAILEGLPEGFGEGLPEGKRERLPKPLRELACARETPPPTPHPPRSSEQSSSSGIRPAAVDDDDESGQQEEILGAALDLVAQRRRAATLTPVANERAYMRQVCTDVRNQLEADAAALLRLHPDLEPEELADRLEAPPAASSAPPRPGPVVPPPFGAPDPEPFGEAVERGKAEIAKLRPR